VFFQNSEKKRDQLKRRATASGRNTGEKTRTSTISPEFVRLVNIWGGEEGDENRGKMFLPSNLRPSRRGETSNPLGQPRKTKRRRQHTAWGVRGQVDTALSCTPRHEEDHVLKPSTTSKKNRTVPDRRPTPRTTPPVERQATGGWGGPHR